VLSFCGGTNIRPPAHKTATRQSGIHQGEAVQAGIIVYRRNGASLVGQWTHENVNGISQKEIVHDVTHGTWEGDWPVEIFKDGVRIFEGRLSSIKLGDCLKLTWKSDSSEFQGVGYAIDDETAAASFEPVPCPPDKPVTGMR
jgi:hypothetical protein